MSTTEPQHGVSTGVLTAMYDAAKALQLYPIENEIVGRSLTELQSRVTEIFEREGGLAVWVAGNYMFVNDIQVRLDLADYAALSALREALRSHGIGRIEFLPRVRTDDWVAFLTGLTSATRPGIQPLEAFQARLSDAGVHRIVVGPSTALFSGGEDSDGIEAARRTYAYSVQVARETMNGLVLGKAVGAQRAERAVLRVVDQVLKDRSTMMGMLTLRDYDDHSLIHAVNVAILSVALGQHLGFGKQQLFELGFAALFHDIGKVLIPTSVLNKQAFLTDEEWRLVSQHPDFGLLIMFDMEGFEDPPYRAMLSIYEHHMGAHLNGYPRVIRRRRQGLFARIIAITEAYDAAISNHGRQFSPCSPDEAIRQLLHNDGNLYDGVLARAFTTMMGVYPVATVTILDTGELGVVVAPSSNPNALSRPLVRIVATREGKRIGDGPIRDLTEVDPATGHFVRSIARSANPQRYGINVSDFVA
ncbi:MAG: HD domain-containing protein [Gemmatimonadota bacterium]|nr:HD domain-containing protein [Gemmatimonadota bacterium]MDH3428217.1 HD domain-containing protein [Gemmatimonadota bacterium]